MSTNAPGNRAEVKDTNAGTNTSFKSNAAPAAPRVTSWGAAGQMGLSRSATSEELGKGMKALEEALKDSRDISGEFTLLAIDGQANNNLTLSSIVVAGTHPDAPNVVSYSVLLLEGSGDPIAPLNKNVMGRPISVSRYASDVMNDYYVDAVREVVASRFAGMSLQQNSGITVPRGFRWDAKDAVKDLLVTATRAAGLGLTLASKSYAPLNVAHIDPRSSLQVTPDFEGADMQDYVGRPVRADLRVALSAVNNQANQQQLNGPARSEPIGIASGFVDLAWAPVAPSNTFGQQQGPLQKFAARLVLTTVENFRCADIGNQLLVMLSACRLLEGGNWMQAFLPRVSMNNPLRDASVLEIEGNLGNDPSGWGNPPDLKSGNVSTMELGKFLGNLIRPDVNMAMDVSRLGPDTYFNGIFEMATRVGPLGDLARTEILRAADELVNGNLAQYFNGNSPVLPDPDIILMGHYAGPDGRRLDIRNLDYVGVMNQVGRTNPTEGAIWSDTFANTSKDIDLRLVERKDKIQQILPDVVFTDVAYRVMIDPAFLVGFAKAAQASGLTMALGASNSAEFQSSRGTASWAGTGVNTNNFGVFNSGGFGGQRQNVGGYSSAAGSRYAV